MARSNLPEQQAFSSSSRQQPPTGQQARQPAGDVIAFTDSAGHLEETDEGEIDDAWPGRLPTSSRRYNPQAWTQGNTSFVLHPKPVRIPPRRSAQPQHTQPMTEDTPLARTRQRRRMNRLWYAGIGAIIALTLWVGAAWVSNWWTNTQNDWTYTQAFRTFSTDKAVGHNGDSDAHPSHFIVQNDNRHIVIIELPADDASKSLIYFGPMLIGDGQDRTPVTISFQLNLRTGRFDMVLHVQDQNYVFTNNGTKFVEPSGQ